MKKCFKYVLLLIIVLSIPVAYAEGCDGVLTKEAADFITDVMTYIRIGVPIILLILCAFDFSGAVTSQDDDAMKKAGKRVIKRFIAAAAVFFVPLIIGVILGIPAVKNNLNLVDDPLCENGDYKSEEELKEEAEKTRVKLSRSNVYLFEGEKSTLTLVSSNKDVTWSSSDEKIATVDSKGKVTAKKKGTARITATAGKNKSTCTVTVRIKQEVQQQNGVKPENKNPGISDQKGDKICNTPYTNLNGHTTTNYFQVFEYNAAYPQNYLRVSTDSTGYVWGAYSFTAGTKRSYIDWLGSAYPGKFDSLISSARSSNYGDVSSALQSAYNAHPTEFIESQDRYMQEAFAFNTTINKLKEAGVDVSKRPSVITGMLYSMADACGAESAAGYLKGKVNNSMSDEEFVDAACDAIAYGTFGNRYHWAQQRWGKSDSGSNTSLGISERTLIKRILAGQYNC